MFRFFFKKENQVEKLILAYLENFHLTLENFSKALVSCITRQRCEEFDFLMDQTHKYESKADDIMDEVNNLMFSKALIPDFRGDIMNLLIALDKIPHFLERALFMIRYQRLVIPEAFVDDLQDLIRISIESCELLSRQVELFLKNETGTRSLMSTIDTNESHCDHIERRIISRLFQSDLDPFLKLQFKELVVNMGDISDQADRVSKLVNILTLKRRV
jgi:predicted phosphate transport protein (TIGR00153 family)